MFLPSPPYQVDHRVLSAKEYLCVQLRPVHLPPSGRPSMRTERMVTSIIFCFVLSCHAICDVPPTPLLDMCLPLCHLYLVGCAGDSLEKVYFHIPNICMYLTADMKTRILYEIDRSCPLAKVRPGPRAGSSEPLGSCWRRLAKSFQAITVGWGDHQGECRWIEATFSDRKESHHCILHASMHA